MANEENLKPITSSEMARALQEKSVAKRKENTYQKMILKDEIVSGDSITIDAMNDEIVINKG